MRECSPSSPLKVFVVAGELSGDVLGGGLLKALSSRHPHIEFKGIGGPRMQAAGLNSLYPLETLSVMGLAEVVRHLPRLIRVRRHLYCEAIRWEADIMIGIDAPDFNIGLERQLRQAGMPTVHYVSPSVWAWRQGRIKKIREAADRMLTFLPFEAAFYEQHDMPVTFVGHPLADSLPVDDEREAARHTLSLSEGPVLAMLPGSRHSEIRSMLPVFAESVQRLLRVHPTLQCVIPAATDALRAEIEQHISGCRTLMAHTRIVKGELASIAMTASDAVLLTSGTSALEAMLCHRPMLVAYRMSALTYKLAQYLVKTPWISLPNLIAQKTLVPELIQDAVTPEAIAERLSPWLSQRQDALEQTFRDMHVSLARNASEAAADAVLSVWSQYQEPAT